MSKEISAILDPRSVTVEIRGKRKSEIVRELVELLGRTGVVTDVEDVTREVLEREKLATTGIGNGIAIPHCLSAKVTGTALAMGRRVPGAKFDAVDRQPVQLFFLMVGLPDAHSEHLQLLSRLMRFMYDSDLKAGLLSAPTPEAMVALFRERENRTRGRGGS